jgi:hypothetical protein
MKRQLNPHLTEYHQVTVTGVTEPGLQADSPSNVQHQSAATAAHGNDSI